MWEAWGPRVRPVEKAWPGPWDPGMDGQLMSPALPPLMPGQQVRDEPPHGASLGSGTVEVCPVMCTLVHVLLVTGRPWVGRVRSGQVQGVVRTHQAGR